MRRTAERTTFPFPFFFFAAEDAGFSSVAFFAPAFLELTLAFLDGGLSASASSVEGLDLRLALALPDAVSDFAVLLVEPEVEA